ncbi:hypothetical protein ACFOYU_11220 [Microvirga sp. GCM10011540]|uniref:hypothetical protein n=1 Tax=Microvirga sp. GCM10011540 TaxID=3317338 RepID=UPI0036098926
MVDSIGYPWLTVQLWPAEDLAAKLKIKGISVDPIPDGKIATSSEIIDDNGSPRRVWTLEDAPPPAPEPVPEVISDRQFAHGLAKYNIIPMEEARAFVRTGDIPPALKTIIDDPTFQSLLPPEMDIEDVYIIIEGATTYERNNPISLLVAQMLGWTSDETDAFWRFCYQL